jgi:hypothetical protein
VELCTVLSSTAVRTGLVLVLAPAERSKSRQPYAEHCERQRRPYCRLRRPHLRRLTSACHVGGADREGVEILPVRLQQIVCRGRFASTVPNPHDWRNRRLRDVDGVGVNAPYENVGATNN